MQNVAIISFWAPLLIVIAFVLVSAVAYLYRSRGRGDFKEGTEQTKVFLSGEDEPEEGMRHVRAHNMYWGFFEAMKQYYGPTVRAHSGIINDYIIWLLAVTAVVGIALFAAGLF